MRNMVNLLALCQTKMEHLRKLRDGLYEPFDDNFLSDRVPFPDDDLGGIGQYIRRADPPFPSWVLDPVAHAMELYKGVATQVDQLLQLQKPGEDPEKRKAAAITLKATIDPLLPEFEKAADLCVKYDGLPEPAPEGK